MGIIFLSSSATGETIQASGLGKEPIQVGGHLIQFFVLCLAYYKATGNILGSVLLAIAYGFVDEYHQTFISERSPSFFDIKVDTIGALLAGVFLWKLQQLLPNKLRNWLNN